MKRLSAYEVLVIKSQIRNIVKKIPLLGKAYVQRDEFRAVLNKLWEPPGHFYSPIPSVEALKLKENEIFNVFPHELPGIELNENKQLALFDELKRYYDEQPFKAQQQNGFRYHFENNAFSYFDAIILFCMIRHLKPKRIIEVGSGYSSCIFLDTNELFFGNSIECTFIEPYPELLMSLITEEDKARIEIIPKNLQDVPESRFESLNVGDILFIDSSHISKTGSDVNYIFSKILPLIKSGVYIHFHDIFYPFEYPKEWVYQGRAWNEAYLLQAFLQYNNQFKIEIFNSYLDKFYKDRILKEMPLCINYAKVSMIQTSGQSIWLKRI
jgi:predicted O-methyltransferase YrrM